MVFPLLVLMSSILFSLLHSNTDCCLYFLLITCFSFSVSKVSIGYNIGQVFGGGVAPAAATELVDHLGAQVPGYYISIVCVISLVGLCFVAPRLPVHFSVVQGQDQDDFVYNEHEEEENEVI